MDPGNVLSFDKAINYAKAFVPEKSGPFPLGLIVFYFHTLKFEKFTQFHSYNFWKNISIAKWIQVTISLSRATDYGKNLVSKSFLEWSINFGDKYTIKIYVLTNTMLHY